MSLISRVYQEYYRPKIFGKSHSNAEVAHDWGIESMKRMQQHPAALFAARMLLTHYDRALWTNVMDIDFPNPFGLAAGFDKYCEVFHGAVPAMGWGFVEVGGFTPLPQEGNPPVRMWRSNHERALCNAMGFNNPGKDVAARRLAATACPIPVFANIAKGKDTPLENAADDYCAVMEAVWDYVDCMTINVSSPNTKDLRNLQAARYLTELLLTVRDKNRQLADRRRVIPKPVGVKISPDLSDEQLADIVTAVRASGMAYVIGVNTTTGEPDLRIRAGFPLAKGGVSGPALKAPARRILLDLVDAFKKDELVTVISVGGIDSADELFWRITHGAQLCQGLTAWPFEGPDFAKRTVKGFAAKMKAHGFKNVADAVGKAL